MIKNSKGYLLSLLMVVLLFVVGYNYVKEIKYLSPAYPWLIYIVVVAGSVISHYIVQYVSGIQGKPFVQVVILTFVFRLLLYGILAFAIIIINENAFDDLVLFGTFYLTMVVHEIAYNVVRPNF